MANPITDVRLQRNTSSAICKPKPASDQQDIRPFIAVGDALAAVIRKAAIAMERGS